MIGHMDTIESVLHGEFRVLARGEALYHDLHFHCVAKLLDQVPGDRWIRIRQHVRAESVEHRLPFHVARAAATAAACRLMAGLALPGVGQASALKRDAVTAGVQVRRQHEHR